MSLLESDEHGVLSMHDSLADMARYIISTEYPTYHLRKGSDVDPSRDLSEVHTLAFALLKISEKSSMCAA